MTCNKCKMDKLWSGDICVGCGWCGWCGHDEWCSDWDEEGVPLEEGDLPDL